MRIYRKQGDKMSDVREICGVFLDFVYSNNILPSGIVNILKQYNAERDFRLVCRLLKFKEKYKNPNTQPLYTELENNVRFLQAVDYWRDNTACRDLEILVDAANDFFHNVNSSDSVFPFVIKELIKMTGLVNAQNFITKIENIEQQMNCPNDDILSVPEYIGTYEDFFTYINDYVKNRVPVLTKKLKMGNVCQYCGKTGMVLEAAHRRNMERTVLIEQVWKELAVQTSKKSIFRINIKDFADRINALHSDPSTFYFLCHDCHRKYDASASTMPDDFEPKGPEVFVEPPRITMADRADKSTKPISKSSAIKIFRSQGHNVFGHVTYASLSKNEMFYWANPDPKFLMGEWWFILNDTKKRECHLFRIPANTFTVGKHNCIPDGKTIGVRSDKDVLDIYVDYNNPSFKILNYNVKLSPYKVSTISY